jgi:type I restriction enzyme M protein
VNTAAEEEKIDLKEVNERLASINERIKTNTDKHNEFLKELGLPLI